MAKYESIQNVVRDFLSEKGDFTDVNYVRYLKMAMRGFANLNIHTLNSFRTTLLTLNTLNQAQLPSDYINWSRIGHVSDNKIVMLDINDDLCLMDSETAESSAEESTINVLFSGRSIPVIYSASYSSTIPSCRVFRDEGIIQFSTTTPKTLVMEYASNGINPDGATYVPYFVAEALVEYLHWRDRKNDKRYTRGEVMDAKMDYLEAERILLDIETLPTLQDIVSSFKSTWKQTPKR